LEVTFFASTQRNKKQDVVVSCTRKI